MYAAKKSAVWRIDLVKQFGMVVVSLGYQLAIQRQFPAAVENCYWALAYLKGYAQKFGVRRNASPTA